MPVSQGLMHLFPDRPERDHEYSSRGDDRDLQGRSRENYQRVIDELEFIEKKWGNYIEHDLYYHPNLTRLFENYGF